MAKVRVNGDQVMFHCVACGHAHSVPMNRWTFNGDMERPTITPSLRIFTPAVDDGDVHLPEHTCCHVVVTDGMLNYCSDCPHELKGQSIPMVEWNGD